MSSETVERNFSQLQDDQREGCNLGGELDGGWRVWTQIRHPSILRVERIGSYLKLNLSNIKTLKENNYGNIGMDSDSSESDDEEIEEIPDEVVPDDN